MVKSIIPPKKLFILGATGGIGRELIDQALGRGHEVTAFARSPEKLCAVADRVAIEKGDPRSADDLARAMAGHDAVLSALGPPGPGRTTIHRDAIAATIAAMKATGVRRLLAVSAAVLFENQGFVVWLMRSTFLRNIAEDTSGMESALMASGLDWTIARPPRLTNGALTGRYLAKDGALPKGRLVMSRADVAKFLLDEVERNEHVGQMVGLAGALRTSAADGAAEARASSQG
jgi:putative NADH-flavin reductase